jgi:chromosome segregation ATPase
MSGDWSVIDLTADPVRGEPAAVRTLANASQQEARRWEEQLQTLRTIASEGEAMEMEGDFARSARRSLQKHPSDASLLTRGRADAGAALGAYAGQLEQAKRESQTALQQGTQAKRNRDTAERNLKQVEAQLKQVQAQMRAMSATTYPAGPAYAAALQRFNMLRAQESQLLAQHRQCVNAWETAEAQRMAARQRAVAAGERAAQQERATAERVMAAAPTRAAAASTT